MRQCHETHRHAGNCTTRGEIMLSSSFSSPHLGRAREPHRLLRSSLTENPRSPGSLGMLESWKSQNPRRCIASYHLKIFRILESSCVELTRGGSALFHTPAYLSLSLLVCTRIGPIDSIAGRVPAQPANKRRGRCRAADGWEGGCCNFCFFFVLVRSGLRRERRKHNGRPHAEFKGLPRFQARKRGLRSTTSTHVELWCWWTRGFGSPAGLRPRCKAQLSKTFNNTAEFMNSFRMHQICWWCTDSDIARLQQERDKSCLNCCNFFYSLLATRWTWTSC